MHITELEIDNFKSFGRKTKIPFLPGFTIISGPNGSGKSNIIDSILFALALSTSRSLRAERLTDLINLNSDRNTAEVEITFSDGTVIKRRIKRTENTYYNYLYLNGRPCRQGELLEFLSGHGIVPHGYNVVMQGDINRIIEMGDTERRKIIDEIAGVSEFDAKKELALGELTRVKDRISEESIHIEELSIRLTQLEKQKEQAVRFRSLQDEQKHLVRCRSAARYKARNKDYESLTAGLAEEKVLISSIEALILQKKTERDRIFEEISEVDQLITGRTGSDYMVLVSRIAEAKAAIDGLRRSISRALREKEEAERRLSEIFAGVKKHEGLLSGLENDMRTLMIDKTNLSMTASVVKKEYDRINQTIAKETKGLEEDESVLVQLRNNIQVIKEERGELVREQDLLIERFRMRSAEEDRLTSKIITLEKDLEVKKEDLSALLIALERLSSEKREHDRQMGVLDTGLYSKRDAHERLNRQIRDLKIDIGRKEAQQQVQGRYNRAMEAVLGMDGVYGTIGDLGSCNPEYSTALSIAAGGKLHFVVVEHDQIAADAIRYLQEHKLGRVTFLPLNKIRSKPLPPLPPGADVIGFATDLLDYDPRFDTAFRVIFGSTLVVDTLEHARKRLGTHRMVTLDGSLLEPSGTMTGGSVKKESGGFGSHSGDEVKMLSSRLSELIEEEKMLSDEISVLTSERDEVQKRRLELEGAMVRAKAQIDSSDGAISSIQADIESMRDQCDESRSSTGGGSDELVRIEASIESKNKEIGLLQEKINEISSRLEGTGIPVLFEQRDEALRQIEEVDRRLRNKEQEINDIRMQVSFKSKNIEDQRQQMDRIRDQMKSAEDEIRDCEEGIICKQSEIAEAEGAVAQFSREVDSLRADRKSKSDLADQVDNEIREEIGRKERIAIKIESINEKLESLVAEMEILQTEAGDCETELSEEEVDARIIESNLALEKIGDVNMRAIEEYEQVHAVVAERMSRMDTLQREMDEIRDRIDLYSRKKYESFSSAFFEIDRNFRDIFSRLTLGTGELRLENEEDPFAGGLSFAVKPRDKNVHHLSALSGGEKSLTTLAFIFALQKYIPAPFYAFDEVDMNLDGSNVIRISEMIQELSKTSQFINISLRKPMIDAADRILGVTIRPDKTSLVTGVSMDE